MRSTKKALEVRGYIYKIWNVQNKLIYIGQTNNPRRRKLEHWRNASNGISGELYDDMRKIGINKFRFKVIDSYPIDELNDWEIRWIKHFDSYHEGYNSTPGGDAYRKDEYSPVLQYDLEGNFIKEYASIAVAANELGLLSTTLINDAIGKKGRSAYGFIWRNKKSQTYAKKIVGLDEYYEKLYDRKYNVSRQIFEKMMAEDATFSEIRRTLKKNVDAYSFSYFFEIAKEKDKRLYNKMCNYSPKVVVKKNNSKRKRTMPLDEVGDYIGSNYIHCCHILNQNIDNRYTKNNEYQLFKKSEYDKLMNEKNILIKNI